MLVSTPLKEQIQVHSRAFMDYWRTIKRVSVTSLRPTNG